MSSVPYRPLLQRGCTPPDVLTYAFMVCIAACASFTRWTAAFHTFTQVEEEETRPRSTSVGGKSNNHTNERLVNDKSAHELVRLITLMTPVRHVSFCLEVYAC